MKYYQCKLRKHNKIQVAWIASKYAIKGKYLRFNEDNGWLVETVYNKSLEESYLLSHERDYKKQRLASDLIR